MQILVYTQRLEKVGFARAQAEEVVLTMEDAMNDKLATKDDLTRETTLIRHDAQIFREEVKSEFQQVRAEAQIFREEVKSEFQQVRAEAQIFREEVKSEFKLVRSEAQVFREEVKGEFKLVRQDMRSISNQIIIKLASIMTILMGFWTGVMTYLR